MEITNNRQVAQQAQSASVTPGRQNLPSEDARVPVVSVKAAPKVPEFEKLDLDQAISELQDFVEGLGRSLSFSQDESIDRSVITVRDTQTNQVVRQIPSEEVVAIARQLREDMMEFRAGMLMDQNA
jgi:flagellar protein FlaG